jgi:hypothetical protein
MKNKVLIYLFIIVFSVGFFIIREARAGAGENVYGWAWSENIGWISFNNTSGGGAVSYGVNIDAGGNLSGYAWSENIGWISFNAGDLAGCPIAPCAATIDLGSGLVAGWARALAPVGRPLSETGGWDGWIRLSGTWANGVILNFVPDPSEFESWAWGGDDNDEEAVIGWISFNNVSGGGATDYEVSTGLVVVPPNTAPTAAISCQDCVGNPLVPCQAYEGENLCLINQSSDPESNITQSEWATSEPPGGYTDWTICVLCDFTPQSWQGTAYGDYVARLIITDSGGLSDTATRNFTILRDASAGFRCSLDNLVWEDCDTITPIAGELVYFVDDQSVDANEYSQASQGGGAIVSREWRRNGAVFSAGNNQNPSVIALAPSMDITLYITDSAFPSARTDTALHAIGSVLLDLPTWQEVTPF